MANAEQIFKDVIKANVDLTRAQTLELVAITLDGILLLFRGDKDRIVQGVEKFTQALKEGKALADACRAACN